jgi:hypothetical protein
MARWVRAHEICTPQVGSPALIPAAISVHTKNKTATKMCVRLRSDPHSTLTDAQRQTQTHMLTNTHTHTHAPTHTHSHAIRRQGGLRERWLIMTR